MALEIELPKLLDETTTVIADTNDLNTVRNVLVLLMERALRDSEIQAKRIAQAERALQDAREEYRKQGQILNDFGAKTLHTKNRLEGLLTEVQIAWTKYCESDGLWHENFGKAMDEVRRTLQEIDKDRQ